MDRLRRHKLKEDKFVSEVTSTLDYVTLHKGAVIRYGSIALATLVVAGGVYWYMGGQRTSRQAALGEALEIQQAYVNPSPLPGVKTYATEQAKMEAARKAFAQVAQKYSNSDEGVIARYYQGVLAAQAGDTVQATGHLRAVIESGKDNYASLARLALSDLLRSEGKTAEAEKELRYLVEHPTDLVSKEQATLALADLIGPTKPEEARKLLEPLRTERSAVSRLAMSQLALLPQK